MILFNKNRQLAKRILAGILFGLCVQTGLAATDKRPPTPAPKNLSETQKATVHWAKPGLAPLYIRSGVLKNQGMGDKIVDTLQENLTQYNHTNILVNYPRMLAEMRKGKSACALLHETKERTDFLHFTKPILIVPGYQAYLSNKGKQTLEHSLGLNVKQASLDALLSNSEKLTLAITRKQSYGVQRDVIIAEHEHKLNINENHSDQSSLIKMLAANRIQIVLAFPWVFNYQIKTLGLNNKTHKIKLTDVPTYQLAHIGCAKTQEGLGIVNAIDAISPEPMRFTGDIVSEWLTDEEIEDYQKAYLDYFQNQGKPH